MKKHTTDPSAHPTLGQVPDFFSAALDLMCVVSSHGYFTQVNARWTDLLGYSQAQLTSMPFIDFVHLDDRKETMVVFEKCNRNKQFSSFVNRFRSTDGTYVWLEWKVSQMGDGEDLLGIARDISKSRAANMNFRSLVEAAPTGLMTVDEMGNIVLANQQIESLFGYSREELIGQSVDKLVPQSVRGRHHTLREHFFRTPAARRMGAGRDLYGVRKDGSEFLVEIGLNPTAAETGTLVHCSIVDVSERKKQESELKDRVDELQRYRLATEHLNEMSSLLQHASSEAEVLSIVRWFGARLFPGTQGAIYLVPPSGDWLDLAMSWNNYAGGKRMQPADCWALRRSQPHRHYSDAPASCRHMRMQEDSESHEHYCVPMTAYGTWLGLLTLEFADEVQPELIDQLYSLAQSVADQFGLALSGLQLRDKLRDLSIKDALTGLYNRRYLEESAAQELLRAKRQQSAIGVLMLDIDYFKAFNDAHGHQAADVVLRNVAKTLLTGLRGEDIACRYGGEEFVVLMPGAGLDAAHQRAESLRQQVSNNSGRKVCISIGVSAYPDHGTTWETLLGAADAALYEAKSGGRNRVNVASVSGSDGAAAATAKYLNQEHPIAEIASWNMSAG